MSQNLTYKNWRLETDKDDILWVYFDRQGTSVNTLNREVMEEFAGIVEGLVTDQNHKGVIIASGKEKGFIAGADIAEFKKFTDINDAVALLRRGQQIFDRLESVSIPVVAMIDGFCVGGGMELALACHYRVAEDSSKTRLGLPEVKLGIHPGWGGTVRLPRLIGGPAALNLILSGSTVTGKVASKIGFVDVAVPKRHLIKAAKYYVLEKPQRQQATFMQKMSNTLVARKIMAPIIRKKVRAKADPMHYPSPFTVIDNWERFSVDSNAAYEREAKTCGQLFFSETCQNLVRVFFLQERMKGLAKESGFKAKHVHVVGAGTMGGDIAAWCAFQGMTVTLQDREPKYIAPAIKRAYELGKEKLKETYLIQRFMDRLIPDVEGLGIPRADVIIEAIYENLPAKQALFKELESKAKPTAILATNTSSIPLDEINKALTHPERLVGIHFFNPVPKMLLVEVVKGDLTSANVITNTTSFVRQLDKLPLPVKSSPGFLVNRILMFYLLEAVVMLDEGVPATAIDKAMLKFGMPMGPITLADTVGLDICLSVARNLQLYYPSVVVSQSLLDKVAQGNLGRKSNHGYYDYKNGKRVKKAEAQYDKPLEEISDRLVLAMLNEAFACLRDGVVADSDLLDAGMIFGTGFAPFLGGPIHYAKTQGIKSLYEKFIKQQTAKGASGQEVKQWEEVS